MTVHKLNYIETLTYRLGKASINYRIVNNLWQHVNVATLEVKFQGGPAVYTLTAPSKPEVKEHSEESILKMFESLNGRSANDIEKIELYSEYKPCVTTRTHQTSLMNQFQGDRFILNASQTIKHQGCSGIISQRFPAMNICHTVNSIEEHQVYIAWLKELYETDKRSHVIAERFDNNKLKSRYQCPAKHGSWVEPAVGDRFRVCGVGGCLLGAILVGYHERRAN